MATVRSSKSSTPTTKSPQSPTSPQSATGNAKQLVSGDGQEDIESIAKQISDHAEAIYQTWKARGLAPTEILNCHTTNDTFGKNLQSPIHQGNMKLKYTKDNNNSPVTELLVNAPEMSNNSLEKLVNTFVNEDKARLAARKRNSPTSGSSIQHALKKFEKNDSPIILNKSSPSSPSSSLSPSSSMKKSNVPDVLMNTLDQVLPNSNSNNNNNNKESSSHSNSNNATNKISSSTPSPQKPQTPVKPANLINHVPSWPLKNRLGNSPTSGSGGGGGGVGTINQSRSGKESSPTKDTVDSTSKIGGGTGVSPSSSAIVTQQQQKMLQSMKNSSDLLDEVSREEERLINALKTGQVLNSSDNKMLPEVITSTLQPDSKLNWKKPDVSTTNQSPNTVTATWNGIQLKPVAASNAHPSKIDEIGNSTYIKLKQPRAPRTENVPHPELSATRNLNVRSTSSSPVRPFLTRGSVAERVLIFERCPEIKTPLRTNAKEPIKIQAKPYIKPLPAHTTLQRHIKNSAKNVYIPRFHFPNGKPLPTITIETTLQRIQAEFNSFPNYQISRDNFHRVVTACGVPLYWRSPLYYCTQLTADGCVDGNRFIDFWKQMTINCNDAASRFITILKGRHTRNHLLPEDFVSLVQDVVDTHPGLQFLKEAAEFHSRYIHTVIARIYYCVNRSWTNRITVQEIRRSNLLQIIQLLEEEEDINQITQYFSYEHFYVIYCKFWELDRDHDLLIDQNDLARHNDHALSTRMIERIFTGGVIKRMRLMAAQTPPNKMTYSEFVYFLLAEEDKAHPTAIEYWFRCMDIDGDGILSMYELQYFYEEQQQRMESLGIEILPFADCICQMLDMIKPVRRGCITLGDLKRCKMTPIFYDTFFNFEKYIENEHRDPFASQRDGDDQMSDWDRYAAMEYELLVSEESGDTQGSCEEEDYEDFLSDFYFKTRSYDEDSDYQEHPTLDLTNLFDHYLENE